MQKNYISNYTILFSFCPSHWYALLARDEYEKRYGKKDGDMEMEENKAMEKTPSMGKKVFRMAPVDSRFECCWLGARVSDGVDEMRGFQDFSYHFSLNSRITSSGERLR